MTPKKLLPRKVAAWCYECKALVPVNTSEESYEKGSYKIINGERTEWSEYGGRRLICHCKTCGNIVDANSLPGEAIDCLRVIAEMIHAGYKG